MTLAWATMPGAPRTQNGTVAAIVAGVGLATIGGFFFFQYVLGYPPCPLCLDQRNAYYICVPLAVLLWLGGNYGAARKVMLSGFAVIAGVMLWNTGLAVYHAGTNGSSGPARRIAAARSAMPAPPPIC